MALSNLSVWELRTTGLDTNGGAFPTGGTGIDRSQSDTPFVSGTNAVVTTATTDIVPDGHTVSANDVDNTVQLNAGTVGLGFYRIVSTQSGNRWRLDRSCGSLAQTATAWSMGGALASLSKLGAVALGGNMIWMKSGTYVCSSNTENNVAAGRTYFNFQGANSNRQFVIEAYQTTRGDRGAKALFSVTTSMSGNSLIRMGGNNFTITGIDIIDNGNALQYGIYQNGNASFINFCKVTGTNTQRPIEKSGNGEVYRCWAATSAATGKGITLAGGGTIKYSYGAGPIGGLVITQGSAHNSTGYASNNQDGIQTATGQSMGLYNCNAIGGINLPTGALATINNCIVMNSSTYAIIIGAATQNSILVDGLAHYNCTSGAYNAALIVVPSVITNVVALSADPFVDSANGNYRLNTIGGGGALLRGTGVPTTPLADLPLSLQYPDYGVFQHAETPGGLLTNVGMSGGLNG